jgi:3-oxoacyl-[acyl-carrier-protein] synthase II
MRRVVVTGMGLVSPLGHRPDDVFDAVLAGRSGVVAMPRFAAVGDLGVRIAAPLKSFEPTLIPRKHRRSMSRMSLYATAAATDALAAARFPMERLATGRVAISAGSTTGSPDAMEEFWTQYLRTQSIRAVSVTAFLRVMSHTVASHLALAFGATGTVLSPCCACAASNQAVGLGLDLIRSGRADAVIAGGADELNVMSVATFDVAQAACRGFEDAPTTRPAPFDRTRDGVVVGEGAAIVVLEERDLAIARGAPILAEILGYGESCDASHMSTPDSAGMRSAIERALTDARVSPSDIDYVCAHATGTVLGDAAEAEATHQVFGGEVPVSSLKGHLGHTLAACGALELILCIQALHRGIVPPTLNLSEPDVAPLRLPARPLPARLATIVSNNFAFGGINASLVVGRAEGLPPG